MRRNFVLVMLIAITSSAALAQADTPPPQTARQALIEMFLGKNPDDFAKHLPDDARRTLLHKGDTSEANWVLRIAEAGHQMTAQGEHAETFDVGPNILVSQERGGNEKLEIAVERDSLMGESEEIELSVHYYKNGQEVPLPVVPRLTFTMQQEKEVWRLTEVTAAAHVPLTDPDYLAGLRKQQNESYESSAQGRISAILNAETVYAAKNPARGYACALSSLFAGDPNSEESGPAAYDPGQGNEEWNGYRFTISGCDGTPATKFRIAAIPIDPEMDLKAYCDDQSRTLKFSADGNPSTCFREGQPVNTGAPPAGID